MVHNRNVLAISLALFLSAHSERATSLEVPAPDYLALGGVSYHVDSSGSRSRVCNENNFGAGLIWMDRDVMDFGRFDVAVGGYYNSDCKLTAYATLSKLPQKILGGHAGLTFGLVTGYSASPILPLAAPTICWKYSCILAMPPIKGFTDGVISLQFRTPF